MPRLASSAVIGALLLGAAVVGVVSPVVHASSGIDTTKAYASGFLSFSSSQGAWYTWVNEGGVKLVFLALYSPVYNSPVFAVVGQEFNASDGSPVFIGNALMAMEVFNDSNHNGILDANYAANSTELRYTVLVNSSQSFSFTPVSQNETAGVTKLHWGVEYKGIDAFLIMPGRGTSGGGYSGGVSAARIFLDHLGISYDYTITNRTTLLLSKYDIGSFSLTPTPMPGAGNATLRGLSLSLLFSTVAIASREYTLTTNATNPGSNSLSSARVLVGDLNAFEYLFNDNYTLYQPDPAHYRVTVASAPTDSIPPSAFTGGWFSPLARIQYYQQSLPMYKGLPSASNLNYTESKFLYRVAFGQWSGDALVEDPTFIAYLGTGPIAVTTVLAVPYQSVAAAALSGIVLAAIAIVDAAHRRKSPRSTA